MTENSSHNKSICIKVKPDDLHEYNTNVPELIETTFDNFELSQNIDKSIKNNTGEFR